MKLQSAINTKLNQWDTEAAINAARAFLAGCEAILVTYPTGLQMMRFAEPYKDYGMHFEVRPEVWAMIQRQNGKLYI